VARHFAPSVSKRNMEKKTKIGDISKMILTGIVRPVLALVSAQTAYENASGLSRRKHRPIRQDHP
jgi:hypothetical protein